MIFSHHSLLVIPFGPRSPLRYLFSNSLYSLSPSLLVIPFANPLPFVISFVICYPLRSSLSPSLLVIPFATRYPLRYSLSLLVLVIHFVIRYPFRNSLPASLLVIPFGTGYPPSLLVFPFGTRYPLRYSLSPSLLIVSSVSRRYDLFVFSYLSGTLDQTKLFKNMTGKGVLQTCYTSDCR